MVPDTAYAGHGLCRRTRPMPDTAYDDSSFPGAGHGLFLGYKRGERMNKVADEKRQYEFTAYAAGTLVEAALERCVDIILAGGAVAVTVPKLRAAVKLVVATQNGEIIGVGALKGVRPANYVRGLAGPHKSDYEFPPETPELGYVAVDARHQGSRLSHVLVAKLLEDESGPYFATTDHGGMKKVLAAAGFAPKGKSWKSQRDADLSLWIRD